MEWQVELQENLWSDYSEKMHSSVQYGGHNLLPISSALDRSLTWPLLFQHIPTPPKTKDHFNFMSTHSQKGIAMQHAHVHVLSSTLWLLKLCPLPKTSIIISTFKKVAVVYKLSADLTKEWVGKTYMKVILQHKFPKGQMTLPISK